MLQYFQANKLLFVALSPWTLWLPHFANESPNIFSLFYNLSKVFIAKILSLKHCGELIFARLHPTSYILLQLYSICTTYTLQTCQKQCSLTLVSHFNNVRFNNFYWSFLCICKYKICDSSAMQYASNKVYQQLKKTRWCRMDIYTRICRYGIRHGAKTTTLITYCCIHKQKESSKSIYRVFRDQ